MIVSKRVVIAFVSLYTFHAQAQNELITPAGQPLRLDADNVSIQQKVSLNSDSGYVSVGGYRFLGIRKTSAGELNVFGAPNSGSLTILGGSNTLLGENSGTVNTSGNRNLFIGSFSGAANTTAASNVLIGTNAGKALTTGTLNTFVGYGTGSEGTTGSSNVFVGISAGTKTNGTGNVFVGRAASYFTAAGSYNVSIGFGAGSGTGTVTSDGSGNVFIGNRAGYYEMGSNKLYIANSNTTTPTIYGEFPTTSPVYAGKLFFNSPVGVGITAFPTTVTYNSSPKDVTGFKVFVNGGLVTKNAILTSGSWADYVFEEGYKLKDLREVNAFIREHGHLPGIPAATDVEQQGVDVREMSRLQQEKIEELTLYIIDQNKKLEQQRARIEAKKAQVARMSQDLDTF